MTSVGETNPSSFPLLRRTKGGDGAVRKRERKEAIPEFPRNVVKDFQLTTAWKGGGTLTSLWKGV